jgi:hypothetical protein
VTAVAAAPQDTWSLTEWERRLTGDLAAASATFTDAEIEGLPEPVQQHLTAAIALGTPLAHSARLRMRGSIKLGRWLPFRARQILCPARGFVWKARVAGLIAGSDHYLDGVGGMDWKLAGLRDLVHEQGPDVSRSSAGRGGAEAVWLPTALLPRFRVRWSVEDDTHISAHYSLGDTPLDLHFGLLPDGRLRDLVFPRWGDPDSTGTWGWHPFGGEFTAHRRFGGLTVPSAGRMGWHYGTDRWPESAFFRYQLGELLPLPDVAGSRKTL